MECNFVVGQKVVCVDDKWANSDHPVHKETIHPKIGHVYTIRDMGPNVDGEIALRFVEIRNKRRLFRDGVDEANFFHWHFRPVKENKTDISIFKKMLTPAPKEDIRIPSKKVKEHV